MDPFSKSDNSYEGPRKARFTLKVNSESVKLGLENC